MVILQMEHQSTTKDYPQKLCFPWKLLSLLQYLKIKFQIGKKKLKKKKKKILNGTFMGSLYQIFQFQLLEKLFSKQVYATSVTNIAKKRNRTTIQTLINMISPVLILMNILLLIKNYNTPLHHLERLTRATLDTLECHLKARLTIAFIQSMRIIIKV